MKVKYLIDDCGRMVGTCDYSKTTWRRVEYGTRDKDGVLNVAGIAQVITLSGLTAKQKKQISEVPHYSW